jgi:ABC-type multidrug transport system fused ATPase/permease subunit
LLDIARRRDAAVTTGGGSDRRLWFNRRHMAARQATARQMKTRRIDVLWKLLGRAGDDVVRWRLGIAATAALAGAGLAALAPLALQGAIDRLAADGSKAAALLAGLYVVALVAGRLCDQAQAYASATGDQHLQRRLAAAAHEHLMGLPLRFHLARRTGELTQASALAIQGVRMLVSHLGFTLLPILTQVIIILIVVAGVFDSMLWLVVGLAMGGYAAVFAWGVRRLERPTQQALSLQLQASGAFLDALASVEAIKGAAAEQRMSERHDRVLSGGEEAWRTVHRRRCETAALTAVIFAASLAAALALAVVGVAVGRYSVGEFVLLNVYLLQIVRPMEMAGLAARDVAQSLSYFDKWSQILGVAPEAGLRAPSAPARAVQAPPAIRFRNVSFGYEPQRRILCGIDFEVPAGGVLAIVGPSGGGKSSLLRLLLRHEAPCEGDILFDDASIAGMELGSLRRSIALVSQDVVLFNDTLRENILFARPDAAPHELERAITLARLDGLVRRLPGGLDSEVGERGLGLSGGERQRVAIARAVLREAPVLVFDEATSAQDPDLEHAIIEGLMDLARARTMLIVTHRLALAARADAILVLAEGRIAERGAHAELMARGGLYARLWRRQLAGGHQGSPSGARKYGAGGAGPGLAEVESVQD